MFTFFCVEMEVVRILFVVLVLVVAATAAKIDIGPNISPQKIGVPTICSNSPTYITVEIGNAADWRLEYNETTKHINVTPIDICGEIDTKAETELCPGATEPSIRVELKVKQSNYLTTVGSFYQKDVTKFCSKFTPCDILTSLEKVPISGLSGVTFQAILSFSGFRLKTTTRRLSDKLYFTPSTVFFWTIAAKGTIVERDANIPCVPETFSFYGSIVSISTCSGYCTLLLERSTGSFNYLEFSPGRLPICKKNQVGFLPSKPFVVVEYYSRTLIGLRTSRLEFKCAGKTATPSVESTSPAMIPNNLVVANFCRSTDFETDIQIGSAKDWNLKYTDGSQDISISPIDFCMSVYKNARLDECGNGIQNLIILKGVYGNSYRRELSIKKYESSVFRTSSAVCAKFSVCEILSGLQEIQPSYLPTLRFVVSVAFNSVKRPFLHTLASWTFSAAGSEYKLDGLKEPKVQILGSISAISECTFPCTFFLGERPDGFEYLKFSPNKFPRCDKWVPGSGPPKGPFKLVEYYTRKSDTIDSISISMPLPSTVPTTLTEEVLVVDIASLEVPDDCKKSITNVVKTIPVSDLKFQFNGKYLDVYPINVCGVLHGIVKNCNDGTVTTIEMKISVVGAANARDLQLSRRFDVFGSQKVFCRSFETCSLINMLRKSGVNKSNLKNTLLKLELSTSASYNENSALTAFWKFNLYGSRFITSNLSLLSNIKAFMTNAFLAVRHGTACHKDECGIKVSTGVPGNGGHLYYVDEKSLPTCGNPNPMSDNKEYSQFVEFSEEYRGNKLPLAEVRLNAMPSTLKVYRTTYFQRSVYEVPMTLKNTCNEPVTMSPVPLDAFNVKSADGYVRMPALDLCGSFLGNGELISCATNPLDTLVKVSLTVIGGSSITEEVSINVLQKSFCVRFDPCDVYAAAASRSTRLDQFLSSQLQFSVTINAKVTDQTQSSAWFIKVFGSSHLLRYLESFVGQFAAVGSFVAQRQGGGCVSTDCGFTVPTGYELQNSVHLYHPEGKVPQCVDEAKDADPTMHSLVQYFKLAKEPSDMPSVQMVEIASIVDVATPRYFSKSSTSPLSIPLNCGVGSAATEISVGKLSSLNWSVEDSKDLSMSPLAVCFQREKSGTVEVCAAGSAAYSVSISAIFKLNSKTEVLKEDVKDLKVTAKSICASFAPCHILEKLHLLGADFSNVQNIDVSIMADFSETKSKGSVSWRMSVLGSRYILKDFKNLNATVSVIGSFMTLRRRVSCSVFACGSRVNGLKRTTVDHLVDASDGRKLPSCQPFEYNRDPQKHSLIQYFRNPLATPKIKFREMTFGELPSEEPIPPTNSPKAKSTKSSKRKSSDALILDAHATTILVSLFALASSFVS